MCGTAITALKKQTANCEIIVSEQPIEKHINKGKLLNKGFKKASGEIIWFCDADFVPEPTLLERMEKYLIKHNMDVVYPMFHSKYYDCLKLADGGSFVKHNVFKEFGGFDEEHLGISWVTFPFLNWCLNNCNFHCSDKFVVDIAESKQRVANKRHWKTSGKLRNLYKETVRELQYMGVWP